MKHFLTAIMAFSAMAAVSAQSIVPASTTADIEIPTATLVRNLKVERKIEAHHTTGFSTMNIKLYGEATFSNACMAAESFVKEISYPEHDRVVIRVLGVSAQANKICPMIYKPVTKKFLITTIGTTDIMPIIEVNGTTI